MPTPRKVFAGQVYDTNNGPCKVLSVEGRRVTFQFIKTGSIKTTNSANLLSGKVKDPYFPNIFSKGFFGEGKYSVSTHRKLYVMWWNMLSRVYKRDNKDKKYYKNCKVVTRWHNFQLFCADIVKMPNWNTPRFELDKDLKVLNNKTYGPKFCTFVPKVINSFIGISSTYSSLKRKEKLKALCKKYKSVLNSFCYRNLMQIASTF